MVADNMTPENQRIAIAQACGWKLDQDPRAIGFWSPPNSTDEFVTEIPDYLNDLNAMHEAEKVLTLDQQDSYAATLGADALRRTHSVITYRSAWKDSAWQIVHATASQRAEAFLRTLGLWTD